MLKNKNSKQSRDSYQSLLMGGGSQASVAKRLIFSSSESTQSKKRRVDSTEEGEPFKEILEKIYRQNSQINAKLDEILLKQKALEKRIDKMEIDYEETNVDKAFANVIKFYIYITKLLYIY
jgi:hypothetical protein